MENGKNQYGRKTWDVDAYARIAKERRENRGHNGTKSGANVIRNLKKEDILRQAVGGRTGEREAVDGESQFGEDNSWFTCQVCRRRFKDSLKLSEHLSSRMHRERLKELKVETSVESGDDHNTPITLDRVKKHLAVLAQRMAQKSGDKVL